MTKSLCHVRWSDLHKCMVMRVLKSVWGCKFLSLCMPGWLLAFLADNSASVYLLYANAQQGMIRSVGLDADVGDVQEPIINLVRPVAVAVDPRNKDIFYSDVNTQQIGRYSPTTGKTTVLHPGGMSASLHQSLRWDLLCLWWGVGGGGVYCCPTSRKNTVLHPCGMCLHYVSVTEMGFDLSLVGCVCVWGGAVRWGGGRDTWTGWMMPSVGLFNLTDSGSLLFGRRVPA